MQLKSKLLCGIAIISFLFVQSPAVSVAKFYAAAQGSTQVTQNAPEFRTTAPEPIAPAKAAKKKGGLLWGILGLAAVAGLVAAVMSGGGGGGGGDDRGTDDPDTGTVTVAW